MTSDGSASGLGSAPDDGATGQGADAAPDAVADAVAEVRDAVESADRLPLDERVATFERANDVLARELAVLDEV